MKKTTPEIDRVTAAAGHQLTIQFKNGETRILDVSPYLNKGIFTELKNEHYFRKVRKTQGGVQWPHEQDLSADTLYLCGKPVQKRK